MRQATKEAAMDHVMKTLRKEVARYDVPVAELVQMQTKEPFRILIATILSARTQDRTTAAACGRLFRKAGNPRDLELLSVREIEQLIYPVGFYRNKAKQLKQLPKVIEQEFNGTIPHDISGLMKLPGVGRKTANLVRAVAFRKPAICVDTHVHRIMNRLGYVKTKTPRQTEMELRKKLPRRHWLTVNRIFVAFGQNVCRPISPKCSSCPVRKDCRRVGVKQSR